MVGSAAAVPVQPNANLSNDQLASRFLAQATFGPSPEAIAALRSAGYDYNAWIDLEIAKTPSYSAPLVTAALASGASPPSATRKTAAPATRSRMWVR